MQVSERKELGLHGTPHPFLNHPYFLASEDIHRAQIVANQNSVDINEISNPDLLSDIEDCLQMAITEE
jgi:hypothetical protein